MVYQMNVVKMTSENILINLVKLVIVLCRNSGIQEGAEVLDLLDLLKRQMRNMQ